MVTKRRETHFTHDLIHDYQRAAIKNAEELLVEAEL
jgi:hypothetical protein